MVGESEKRSRTLAHRIAVIEVGGHAQVSPFLVSFEPRKFDLRHSANRVTSE
jgi:hypothetical protein